MRKGYKQTDVGIIPEDWNVTPLGQQLRRIPNYGINAAATSFDFRFPTYLRITDITEDGRFDETTKASVDHPASASYLLEPGDIVFARTGASVGKSYLFNPEDGQLVFAGFLIRVSPDTKRLIPAFLKFYVQSRTYWNWIKTNSMRSGQPGINGREYASLPIPLPPTLAEQEAIAEALSDADALIEAVEQLLTKKRQIKQGAIQELLTGKKRLLGFEKKSGYKQTEVGIIPEDWDAISILQICDDKKGSIKIGPFGSQLKREYLVSSGYKVYGQENVYAQDVEIGDRYLTKEHFLRLKSCELLSGDFIVSMMGTIGQCMIVPDGIQQGIIDSHLIRIRLNPKVVVPRYMSYYYSSKLVFDQISRLQVGGIMAGLSSSVIKQIYIGLPNTTKEQTAIAEILSDMDAEITALEEKLVKARQVKAGMMSELLSGKIRLV